MAQYMSAPPCLVRPGPRRIRGRPVTLHCRSLPGELSSPDWGRQGVIVLGPGGDTEGGSGLEETKLPSTLGRLHATVDAELAVETLEVRLDRIELDVESAGDLGIGPAGCQQPQHVALPLGQRLCNTGAAGAGRSENRRL